MLQLLSPAGLWTLAALALPLAIHLWRPPPMTVRLGSLRFLDNLPHRRLRTLRWRERALLAVRLALLAALAVLVAGPRWQKQLPTGPQRWVLLDPTSASSDQSANRLQQLRASGYAVHRLSPGLPALNPASRSGVPAGPVTPPDLWSLLREADAALPAGSTLAVFTPGRLSALRGARPALRHAQVEWVATPDAAGTSAPAWIESLHRLATTGKPGGARAVVGTSGAGATAFATALGPPVPGAAASPLMEFSADGSRARLAGPVPSPWVAAEQSPTVRVLILHDADRAGDARYLAAAARAVAAVTGEPFDIATRLLDGPAATADWVFWLSALDVPAALADATPNLVSDAGTGPRDLPATGAGWIVAAPGSPGASALSDPAIRLWRRTPAPPEAVPGNTLWTNGQGAPLLTLDRTTHGRRWHFHGRFHPDWSDLPHTAALAAWMRDLLAPQPPAVPAEAARDVRLADASQFLPSLSPAAVVRAPTSSSARDPVDLHWPLWLLVAALFAAERLLSRRAPRESVHVPAPTPADVSAR